MPETCDEIFLDPQNPLFWYHNLNTLCVVIWRMGAGLGGFSCSWIMIWWAWGVGKQWLCPWASILAAQVLSVSPLVGVGEVMEAVGSFLPWSQVEMLDPMFFLVSTLTFLIPGMVFDPLGLPLVLADGDEELLVGLCCKEGQGEGDKVEVDVGVNRLQGVVVLLGL